jgi:glucokinase
MVNNAIRYLCQHNNVSHSVIGVDIGGTKIAAGRVNQRAEVAGAITLPTRATEGFDVSIAQLLSAIEQTLTTEVEAIGICAPGPLSPKTGVILNPPNLPGWIDIPLLQITRDKFGLPVELENDCNAAALGEARFGAGRGHSNVFYAAIGTGIGSGIVLNGELYCGAHEAAGEAGHVTVDYRSPVICTCGAPGCIEAIASGLAIAQEGSAANQHVEAYAGWLGSIVSLLDPGIIVLGGGVLSGSQGPALLQQLRELVPKRTVNPYASQIPIVEAQLGGMSGVIGAASIARGAIEQY